VKKYYLIIKINNLISDGMKGGLTAKRQREVSQGRNGDGLPICTFVKIHQTLPLKS
jgi:hypothetical protein